MIADSIGGYLRLVKRGESIEIVEHSVPIARIESLRSAARDSASSIEHLVREGLARAPRKRLDAAFWSFRPIACSADAARAVVDERGER